MNLEEKNIREILLGGEETVSPHVWAGVARGLDKAAAAPRRRVVVLWSSLVALAAAAAVAAVVVFTPSGKPQIPVSNTVAVVESPAEEPAAPETPEVIEAVEAPEIQEETLASQVARSRAAGSVVAYVQEPVKETSQPVMETAEEPARVPEVREPVASEPAVSAPVAPEEPVATAETPAVASAPVESQPVPERAPSVGSMDPFALLMAEENRIGNKPAAITLSGLAQAGRASRSNYGGSGKMAAPTAPVTGVRETGDNRFELPISFGLGLRFPLVAGLSIGAGLNYTRLARSFTGTYTEVEGGMPVRTISDVTISETQQYIGLPVNVYYDIVSNKNFLTSAFLGATVERCLGINYRIPDSGSFINYAGEPQGLQPSVAAGISLQYNFLPKFALYAEPAVRYYFDAHQTTSIRTVQPWMVNLELGLRYNL